ncbi:MAG: lipopolysaccharide heptosyltransferase II [Verrucomicrobia bacterium]|nr:lipopolysaccharide heptosyltransferase II [Verrucomicrobiota bacterium]MCG2678817.1 lipopolysaccharide heptosyltransferase II [Kiritimatiellia bacterium]MBU4248677.1 lipopolysaccharide heptosyltransferase II [Verrucomicrobiota bacterium]MBU4289702.1 lipopolysaccharide heptosyltransferase II [Verrucomicrobiota bacterium]MBU4429326.1 lipopolysaccharide heptosyltransferase II [Verrucomicrobiota bacterium]
MPAYPESVSADTAVIRPEDAVLIAGVNWLGDSIMSMPAIQAFRQAHPQTKLVMLVKPKLAALWTLQGAIDETWSLPDSLNGMIRTARRAAARRFRAAYILPHSFRSALVPFLARIPKRVGMPGHARDWMLTRVVQPPSIPGQKHQCHEYMALLGMSEPPAPTPRLTLAKALRDQTQSRMGTAAVPWAALLPGSAFGLAKCWPAEHFIALGKMLKSALNCGIVLLGSASERDLCELVAQGIGPGTVNFAGQTSLPELAAILARCAVVVANDSGGMHLAAAVGTPVLAIFGITDPQKTGPLGVRTRVLQDSSRRSRDIERTSEEAALSLRRIRPEQVLEAARILLKDSKLKLIGDN